MRKAPAFQFYAEDFLVGTAMMSAEEVGGYIRLLCHQWSHGALPNDDAVLSRLSGICGGITLASVRHKFGIGEDGLLRNARLEQIRTASKEYREKQSKNAHSRWKNNKNDSLAMPPHMPEAMPNTCSPSPSPSPVLLSERESGVDSRLQTRVVVPPVPALGPEHWKDELRADKAFCDAWRDWRQHLAEKGKTITRMSEESQLQDCARLGPTKSTDIIRFSILRGASNIIWEGQDTRNQTPDTAQRRNSPKKELSDLTKFYASQVKPRDQT